MYANSNILAVLLMATFLYNIQLLVLFCEQDDDKQLIEKRQQCPHILTQERTNSNQFRLN